MKNTGLTVFVVMTSKKRLNISQKTIVGAHIVVIQLKNYVITTNVKSVMKIHLLHTKNQNIGVIRI